MPKKKWIVATAALAVVKGKKLTNKKNDKASKKGKRSSSEFSFVSSESFCSSSVKEHSRSDDTDSYSNRSSDGSRVTGFSGRGQQSDGSDPTDSSSSYGCGTYHRRESLSQSSSSSSYSDESSFSSRPGYDSSGLSESHSTSKFFFPPESEDLHSVGAARPEPNDYVSHVEDEVPNNRSSEPLSELVVGSRPSLKSLVKAMSSKKLAKRDVDVDFDVESEASSKVSRLSTKSSISTTPNVSLNLSMYDDEQASMMQRRRSSTGGGRGRGGRRGGQGRVGSVRELKSDGLAADRGFVRPSLVLVGDKKLKTAQNVEDKFSDLLRRVRNQKLADDEDSSGGRNRKVPDDEDSSGGELKREDAEDKLHVLLQRVRSQYSVDKSEISRMCPAGTSAQTHNKKKPQAASVTNSEAKIMKPVESPATTESRDAGGELSYSLKTELLANANSNLRSSVTSIASEESADSLIDDASKKNVGSSRFASMMANLKSSNEANLHKDSMQSIRSSRDDDVESDDEHIFEAPKIVNERGQSMRSLSSNEISSSSVRSEDSKGEMKGEEEDEDQGKRSRFRVRRPSHRQLTGGKSDKSLETALSRLKDDDEVKQYVSSVERVGEYHSDDDSKHSDASISTASSGEDQNASSVTNLARMRYPVDEENSSDDDLEYYGEPAMTILTPITEMGSMESDVETTSHSDASETDSDDDVIVNPRSADPLHVNFFKKKDYLASERGRLGKPKNVRPSDIFRVIERVRANDPDLKRLKLDDIGLNDFDAAKLLYLLHGNTYVTHVSLANNKLGDGSAVSLAQVLIGSETITFICLRGNNIGNQGALALRKVLKVNETLIHLDINDNNIDSYVMQGLQKSSTVIVPSDPFSSHTRAERNAASAVEDESAERLEHIHLSGKGLCYLFSQKASDVSPIFNQPLSSDCISDNRSVIYSQKIHLSEGRNDDKLSLGSNSEPPCAGSNEGAVFQSPATVAFCAQGFFPTSSEDEDNDTLNSCSLVKIYDKSTVPDDNHNRATFQDTFSLSRESDSKTRGETALLLAMAHALSSLDSEWLVKSTLGGAEVEPRSTHNTLGERDRLLPLKNCAKIEEHDAVIDQHDSNENRTSMREANWTHQDMSRSRWKDSMSKYSSLRNSLFSLSQQNINEEQMDVSTNSVNARSHPLSCNQHAQDKPSISPSLVNLQQWASSFKKLDPRWQIRKFFNDISVFGTVLSDITQSDHLSEGAAIFSVWRPTSADAIAKMMRGDGVGKGLEIKGKSAKKGDLSGYIPFLQIHHEDHKNQIRTIPKGDRTKIFLKSHDVRDRVGEYLGMIAKELTLRVAQAKFALARAKFGCDPNVILREELNYAAKTLSYELENPKVVKNDDYAPEMYCIEVSCRVLWEGLVERKDISRSPESNFDTGRASQPAFQDMNFAALRLRNLFEPLPVLYQNSKDDQFDARMLVMAYEEEGKVVPVVSDFDCFLIGSRNFSYEDPMSQEQVELLDWCVSQIEWILDNHSCPESWTTRWLEVLKYAARNGFYPSMPRFGFGDPTSYSMIEASVHRSAKTCGAVRHGPECFNFFFPQEIDEEFLIIFPGSRIWQYITEKELISILHEKIQEGFTFPLNPKWLLCDPGWISLFQDLLNSNHSSVQDSIDLWFPPESGLRERILNINQRFPNGFLSGDQVCVSSSLAEEEYERYLILQRARRKMRGFIYWRNLLLDVRLRATSI